MRDGRILILNVNDSASNRYYVSRVLRAAGWDVLEATTGGEGIELARTERPDLIVLDIKLPDISGLDVCRQLKHDPATADILVIQTSATFVTSEGKARGLESGADQYLTQPFESIELVAMVRGLLRMHEKEIEAQAKADALSEADKRKDEFLAMLAHELRNPLAAIMTAHTLLEQIPLPANGARLTGTIGRQTRHLARLVDDLLDVSRITRGKIQLRKEPFDLGALVERFVGGEASAATKDRSVTVDVAAEPMWIEGDVTRIEQVITNLLSNAVKYSSAGGKITIALAPAKTGKQDEKKCAVLTVRDDGVGITKENIGNIFDLFFQVDPTLARSQAGLGIGLTMVKRLVEMHGGHVSVSSDGSGLGSEFRIELPLVAPHRHTPAADVAKKSPSTLRVLLVDDNEDSCELLALAFENDGHQVQTANDGERGLEIALSDQFDVAVVDIGLPMVDGYEVARRIRSANDGHAPVLLALTGYGRNEDKERALAAGFDAHLVKPVDLGELQRTVARLVARRTPVSRSA
ncbi:MAG: response regulator [Labilithrix sp.]